MKHQGDGAFGEEVSDEPFGAEDRPDRNVARHGGPAAHCVLGQRPANSINHTIARLAQILEVAVGYRYLDRNPARGRRRRLTGVKPRRTFASLLFEAGATVPYVMDQLGQAHPKVALSVHAHVLRHKEDTGERMDALVRDSDWAVTGRIGATGDETAPTGDAAEGAQRAWDRGKAGGGGRTRDLLITNQALWPAELLRRSRQDRSAVGSRALCNAARRTV
jgi:hypothetical protein